MKASSFRMIALAFTLAGLTTFGLAQNDSSNVAGQGRISQSNQIQGLSDPSMNPIETIPLDSGRAIYDRRPAYNQANGQTNGQISTGRNANDSPLETTVPTQIMFNGTAINFYDAQPQLINGQLMVPVRAFAEQTGATVRWDEMSQSVEIVPADQPMLRLMAIPQSTAFAYYDTTGRPERFAGGSSQPSFGLLADQVVVIDDHSYMPLDKLAATFNGASNWDPTTGTATITVPRPESPSDIEVAPNPSGPTDLLSPDIDPYRTDNPATP